MSPVLLRSWGAGETSPGADEGGVSPVPVRAWTGVSPHPWCGFQGAGKVAVPKQAVYCGAKARPRRCGNETSGRRPETSGRQRNREFPTQHAAGRRLLLAPPGAHVASVARRTFRVAGRAPARFPTAVASAVLRFAAGLQHAMLGFFDSLRLEIEHKRLPVTVTNAIVGQARPLRRRPADAPAAAGKRRLVGRGLSRPCGWMDA